MALTREQVQANIRRTQATIEDAKRILAEIQDEGDITPRYRGYDNREPPQWLMPDSVRRSMANVYHSIAVPSERRYQVARWSKMYGIDTDVIWDIAMGYWDNSNVPAERGVRHAISANTNDATAAAAADGE